MIDPIAAADPVDLMRWVRRDLVEHVERLHGTPMGDCLGLVVKRAQRGDRQLWSVLAPVCDAAGGWRSACGALADDDVHSAALALALSRRESPTVWVALHREREARHA